ncbi:involved in de novo 2-like protein, partial [Tanacetum coccineum]
VIQKKTKKDKANHIALAKYLEKDISEASGPTQRIDDVDHLEDHDGDERFVWAWKGAVVNLRIVLVDWRYIVESGSSVRDKLTKSGFIPTRAYEADHHGKMDWNSDHESKSGIFGWVARADDYRSNTIMGEHLRKIADIRIVSDIKEE